MNAPSAQTGNMECGGHNSEKDKFYLRCSSCGSNFAIDPVDVIGPSIIRGIPPHIDPVSIEREQISSHFIWWVSLWWNGYIAFLLVLLFVIGFFIM